MSLKRGLFLTVIIALVLPWVTACGGPTPSPSPPPPPPVENGETATKLFQELRQFVDELSLAENERAKIVGKLLVAQQILLRSEEPRGEPLAVIAETVVDELGKTRVEWERAERILELIRELRYIPSLADDRFLSVVSRQLERDTHAENPSALRVRYEKHIERIEEVVEDLPARTRSVRILEKVKEVLEFDVSLQPIISLLERLRGWLIKFVAPSVR